MAKIFEIKFKLFIVAGLIFSAALAISSTKGGEKFLQVSEKRWPSGHADLVSVTSLPNAADGTICEWPARAAMTTPATFRQTGVSRNMQSAATIADRSPVRIIRDEYPNYSAVAVDTNSNEVYLQDENLFGIKVFNRTDNTPANANLTEPKRVIGGFQTKLEFNCGLYIDPVNGDVYSVNNDTIDTMVIFQRGAKGNIPPSRELKTPHRTFGIAVDEDKQELYLAVEFPPQVVVYRKGASGTEKPIRVLEGPDTQLHDAHGIAIDTRKNLMFVSNHGATSNYKLPGSGKFYPPSITVYPLNVDGNTAPLRVIEGSNTQLNWPALLSADPESGDVYVANDVGNSILVFRSADSGNVKPSRVIKGSRTNIKNPTGLFVDVNNRELWVSNMGNHSALVFPLSADGNVAPIRSIRSAPADKPALAIGNPGAVAYDSKRNEILVPNWVAHPQIAAFARMAKENSKPNRLIAGQMTLLARTMHDIRYDAVNDEFLVMNPFGQAVLIFRGSADGEEAPIRVIQGSQTQMEGTAYSGVDMLEVDPVNNEIVVPSVGSILVFPRTANGDTAPIRVIKGPNTKMRAKGPLAVDAVHNLIVRGIGHSDQDEDMAKAGGSGGFLIYNREDNGDVKPKATIGGPKLGHIQIAQVQVYPPRGWIVAAQQGVSRQEFPDKIYIGIWNIHDKGDALPRYTIGGPRSKLLMPRGVVLNPRHKEVIVADMRLNAVLTFSFPEIF
jgi:6-phosphogluconolactonase (cycloisomerase 2 family)